MLTSTSCLMAFRCRLFLSRTLRVYRLVCGQSSPQLGTALARCPSGKADYFLNTLL